MLYRNVQAEEEQAAGGGVQGGGQAPLPGRQAQQPQEPRPGPLQPHSGRHAQALGLRIFFR